MTRLNLVTPQEIKTKQLVAEYYELPYVYRCVYKRVAKGHVPSDCDIPETYRVGEGHVKFFYDKLKFLTLRHESIVQELLDRGVNCKYSVYQMRHDWAALIPGIWWGDYTPTEEAIVLNREQIAAGYDRRKGEW